MIPSPYSKAQWKAPKKKPKVRMGVRQEEQREFPRHRKFVRGFVCSVPNCLNDNIQCAHVRSGLPAGEQGGVSLKPHDMWTAPLCHEHHAEQHRLGEKSFERKYRIDLYAISLKFARLSPCQEVRAKASAAMGK